MFQVIAVSVIATLAKAAGGPTFSVCSLCEAAAAAGVKQSLVTVQAPAGKPEHLPGPDLVETIRVGGFHFQRLRFFWSPTFKSALRRYCRANGVNTIQSHGIWTQPNHAAATLAKELGLPLVTSTHGMLAPWALRHKAWKKRLGWRLYQRRDLSQTRVFRATAKHEADAIRSMGFTQPIAVIPNGVEIPEWTEPSKGSEARVLLFVGRICPVKGLLNLVKAWATVGPSGWCCIIAGPDEAGYRAEVEAAIRSAGVQGDFSFRGSVDGKAKWQLYRSADLLVLPSFTENFGLVVAEGLACGVPVITTKGTPWEELPARQCGWWIDIGVEPLTAALREAMALSDEQRRAMGQRGRRLVEENYSWPKIGADMKAVYDWVLGYGPKPQCVINQR
jgi:glycosyltransferase involved in cell wall biosynthesis